MRLYETTFILSPQADDATFDRQIKAVSDVIHRYDGKVFREYRWGIRRLAYPIKRFTQGFYTRVIFDGNTKALAELERFYKIEEPYIRYLTVIYEGNLDNEPEDEIGAGHDIAAVPKPLVEPAVAPNPEAPAASAIEVKPTKEQADKFEEKYGDQDI